MIYILALLKAECCIIEINNPDKYILDYFWRTKTEIYNENPMTLCYVKIQ